MSAWFRRKEKGIQTATEEKKDTPKGLWYKSPTGKIVESEELAKNFYVSPEDDYHVRIGSKEYFEILFDGKFKELDPDLEPQDPLKFEDTKKYVDRIEAAQRKTGLKDAVRTAIGKSMAKIWSLHAWISLLLGDPWEVWSVRKLPAPSMSPKRKRRPFC